MSASNTSLNAYFRDLRKISPLTIEEEYRLLQQLRAGNTHARDRFLQANLRFVIKIARRYRRDRVPLEDLIAAGNLGLIIAADRFDMAQGYRFTSYAGWWIRNQIQQTLAELTWMIRMPVNRIRLLGDIARVQAKEHKKRPSMQTLARKLSVSVEQIRDAQTQAQETRSLCAPTDAKSARTLFDVIPDTTQPPPDQSILYRTVRECVQREIEALGTREAMVLRLFFGFDSERPLSLSAIGIQMNLSRERVRQIKDNALNRLRHPARRARLMDLLDGM